MSAIMGSGVASKLRDLVLDWNEPVQALRLSALERRSATKRLSAKASHTDIPSLLGVS